MTQKVIINTINITIGKKQYHIVLDEGHIADISYGEFEETNIHMTGSLSSVIQDCIYHLVDYEKHNDDWYKINRMRKMEYDGT